MERNKMVRWALAMLLCAQFACAVFVPALAQAGPKATGPSAPLDSSWQVPEGFVRLDLLIPDIVLDMRYAGANNFVGSRVDGYEAPVALLTRQAAEALARVADTVRPMGMRLCVYDAYRPETAVAHFARWAGDEEDTRMQADYYPKQPKRSLFAKGYIAKRSDHSRGSCVDVTLVSSAGVPLDMGGTFDLFSPISAHGAKGLMPAQSMNRKLLRSVMAKQGFKAYKSEWWHYSLKNEPFLNKGFSFPVRDRVFAANISRYIANHFYNTTDVINIPSEKSRDYEYYNYDYVNIRKMRADCLALKQEKLDNTSLSGISAPPKETRIKALHFENTLELGPKISTLPFCETLKIA